MVVDINSNEQKDVFDLKFIMAYIEPFNFKEKDIKIIDNIITNARLGNNIYFYKVGNISFAEDDVKHWNPHIELFDSYKRGKTNCICFKHKDPGNHAFKYIFVYETNNHDNGFYGIIAYDEHNNTNSHIYGLAWDYTNLVVNLQRVANRKINQTSYYAR